MLVRINILPYVKALSEAVPSLTAELPKLLNDWCQEADARNDGIVRCKISTNAATSALESAELLVIKKRDNKLPRKSEMFAIPIESMSEYILSANRADPDGCSVLLRWMKSVWTSMPTLYAAFKVIDAVADDDEHEIIKTLLKKKNLRNECPRCGQKPLEPQKQISQYHIYDQRAYSTIILLCNHCGWLAEHAIERLDL